MQSWIRIFLCSLVVGVAASRLYADPQVGMPRDELIVRYGDPKSVIAMGDREILTYEHGKVVLQNGLVTSCDFSSDASVVPAHSAAVTVTQGPKDGWLTDLDQGLAEAKATNKRVVALFTGSTWCPACIRFEKTVAHTPEFLRGAQKKYVLVKLDYPHEELSPNSKAYSLMQRYQVSGYPTMLLLDAKGGNFTAVDLMGALNNRNAPGPEAVLAAINNEQPGGAARGKLIHVLGVSVFVLLIAVWWIKR